MNTVKGPKPFNHKTARRLGQDFCGEPKRRAYIGAQRRIKVAQEHLCCVSSCRAPPPRPLKPPSSVCPLPRPVKPPSSVCPPPRPLKPPSSVCPPPRPLKPPSSVCPPPRPVKPPSSVCPPHDRKTAIPTTVQFSSVSQSVQFSWFMIFKFGAAPRKHSL